MSEWSHLPNAQHVDRILASAKEHPEKWGVARSAARSAARGVARGVAWSAARSAAWEAARGAAWDAAWGAAWDAIAALIAWDHAGKLLDLTEKEVRALADMGSHEAILILPAVIVFASIEETTSI